MKKGIQYTHYTAGNITEIINSLWLANELINEGNLNEAKEYMNAAKLNAEECINKIMELDKINNMNF